MIEVKERKKPTIEQKDKVGLLFITKILRLDNEIANKFAEFAKRHAQGVRDIKKEDLLVFHRVGMKLAAIPANTDCCEFWNEIENIFPGYNLNYDLPVLTIRGIDRVLEFVFCLSGPRGWESDSPVLRFLAINAHAYK